MWSGSTSRLSRICQMCRSGPSKCVFPPTCSGAHTGYELPPQHVEDVRLLDEMNGPDADDVRVAADSH